MTTMMMTMTARQRRQPQQQWRRRDGRQDTRTMGTMMAADDEDNEVDGDGATTNHYLVSTLVKHSTNTVSYLQSNHFVYHSGALI